MTVWDCSGLESKSFGAVGKDFLPIASGLVGSCGWYCDDGCRRSKALCLWCFDVAVLGDRRKDGFDDKKARTPRLSPLNYGSGTEDDGSIPVGVFADRGISREEDFKYCLRRRQSSRSAVTQHQRDEEPDQIGHIHVLSACKMALC